MVPRLVRRLPWPHHLTAAILLVTWNWQLDVGLSNFSHLRELSFKSHSEPDDTVPQSKDMAVVRIRCGGIFGTAPESKAGRIAACLERTLLIFMQLAQVGIGLFVDGNGLFESRNQLLECGSTGRCKRLQITDLLTHFCKQMLLSISIF